MLIDANTIYDRLQILTNQRIKAMGRAGNMLWVGFGDDVKITNYKNEERIVDTFSLHIQCVWRLVSPDGIVVGYRDFYHPSQRIITDEWDWDVQGNNLFDEIAEKLTKIFTRETITVTKIVADNYGDLSIELSNGCQLQAFPDDSLDGEHWRFFDNSSDESHFVVFE